MWFVFCRGLPRRKGIPVIVMTAKNFDDSTIKMIKAEGNVFGFLNKPFKPSDLIKMLEVVIKGGKALGPRRCFSAGNGVALSAPTGSGAS
jgi:DNA-binding response OmpR family regulator